MDSEKAFDKEYYFDKDKNIIKKNNFEEDFPILKDMMISCKCPIDKTGNLFCECMIQEYCLDKQKVLETIDNQIKDLTFWGVAEKTDSRESFLFAGGIAALNKLKKELGL